MSCGDDGDNDGCVNFDDDPYNEGYYAGMYCLEPYCPYIEDSIEYQYWHDGYQDGRSNV